MKHSDCVFLLTCGNKNFSLHNMTTMLKMLQNNLIVLVSALHSSNYDAPVRSNYGLLLCIPNLVVSLYFHEHTLLHQMFVTA